MPDDPEGEPVKIRGYYCEPQDGQKHPVIMHFYGYDTQGSKSKCECPSGGSSQYAEFYLSHRGQYLNNRPASTGNPGVTEDCENIYGDWFSYHFGNADTWYYRGAFMDVVQAVRFMATREASDMTKLFAEGSSQGGALTYACAALSDYPCAAIACNVAFLGDYADAMDIGGLAAETSKRCQGSMTKEEMLRFLSYFDTKNLATRISCPVPIRRTLLHASPARCLPAADCKTVCAHRGRTLCRSTTSLPPRLTNSTYSVRRWDMTIQRTGARRCGSCLRVRYKDIYHLVIYHLVIYLPFNHRINYENI